ncbi:unnamed protein product [Coffea canephora]|uniref:Uncharacterized protein n=1 Tax=Coffea canephora TaxID=49390 RepID=A0A068UFX1_COFCA|nr:unnamed protein product [Coffea canephora]
MSKNLCSNGIYQNCNQRSHAPYPILTKPIPLLNYRCKPTVIHHDEEGGTWRFKSKQIPKIICSKGH